MRLLCAAAMVLALSGCASPDWDKPGATSQDLATDSYICERDRRQSGFSDAGLVGIVAGASFQDRCMVAHGWTARAKPAAQ